MAKPGRAYEDFVAGLHRALLEAERILDGRNIEVELNKIINRQRRIEARI